MINPSQLIKNDSRIQHRLAPILKPNEPPVSFLVRKLCRTLETEKIDYCHWKSNEALTRSATGDNDLDLLVGRADAQRFTAIIFRLGFRAAYESAEHKLPGVIDYYGYDTEADRLIHVHVHYQLILGNDLSKNYRIPVERPYLDSASQTGLFRIPAAEFELVVFVLRMILKHNTWDSILMGHGKLSSSEQREFEYLTTPENLGKARKIIEQYLPYLDQALFNDCVRVLQRSYPLVKRIGIGKAVQRALVACARRPQALDITLKFYRRVSHAIQGRFLHRTPKRRLNNGGLLIAIVGGDGSGKTTMVDGLYRWLAPKFDVMKFHMGKPAWSWSTIAIRGLLKIGTVLGLYSFEDDSYEGDFKFPGYPWLIRTVCTAHDRYLTYRQARRFASNGGLAICDRFPLPDVLAMDAPQCRRMAESFNKTNWFLHRLTKIEAEYYQKITTPDLLIVLRLNPEIAVQRKKDESAASVRARSTLVWKSDWSKNPACILDASLPRDEVLAQIKSLVWENL